MTAVLALAPIVMVIPLGKVTTPPATAAVFQVVPPSVDTLAAVTSPAPTPSTRTLKVWSKRVAWSGSAHYGGTSCRVALGKVCCCGSRCKPCCSTVYRILNPGNPLAGFQRILVSGRISGCCRNRRRHPRRSQCQNGRAGRRYRSSLPAIADRIIITRSHDLIRTIYRINPHLAGQSCRTGNGCYRQIAAGGIPTSSHRRPESSRWSAPSDWPVVCLYSRYTQHSGLQPTHCSDSLHRFPPEPHPPGKTTGQQVVDSRCFSIVKAPVACPTGAVTVGVTFRASMRIRRELGVVYAGMFALSPVYDKESEPPVVLLCV